MKLILGDCLEKMKDIESGSVDLTLLGIVAPKQNYFVKIEK